MKSCNKCGGVNPQASDKCPQVGADTEPQPTFFSFLRQKKNLRIMLLAIAVGLGGGYLWGYTGVALPKLEPWTVDKLREQIVYSRAHLAKSICTVLVDCEAYDRPSALRGKVLAKLARGSRVLEAGLEDSLDKGNIGIIAKGLTIKRIFSHSYFVPAGTEAYITGFDSHNEEILCRVRVDGKEKNITVTEAEIKLPYKGKWRKIRLENGSEGYVVARYVSSPMKE